MILSYKWNVECLFRRKKSSVENEWRIQKNFEKNIRNEFSMKQNKIRFRNDSNDISNDINFIFKENQLYYASLKKKFWFCISWKLKKNIFQIIHDQNHHCEFHRIYIRAIDAIYIKHFFIRLKRYIRHCKQCLKAQTTKHVSYKQLISIKIMTLFFHTIIIDFIVALPSFESEINAVFIITDKYFKRISMFSKIII